MENKQTGIAVLSVEPPSEAKAVFVLVVVVGAVGCSVGFFGYGCGSYVESHSRGYYSCYHYPVSEKSHVSLPFSCSKISVLNKKNA